MRLAKATFPLLGSSAATPAETPDIVNAQNDIAWADGLVFPLWIGSGRTLVRAFLEQVSRGGLFAQVGARGGLDLAAAFEGMDRGANQSPQSVREQAL